MIGPGNFLNRISLSRGGDEKYRKKLGEACFLSETYLSDIITDSCLFQYSPFSIIFSYIN
jgi:hypothetical protein